MLQISTINTAENDKLWGGRLYCPQQSFEKKV